MATESVPERKELKAGWKTDVEVGSCSLSDVSKHKSKTDMWIVIHGKVYDVTEYAKDHPGGVDALLEVAGTDATSAYEDVGHSEDAREIMHPYLVKVLEGAAPGVRSAQKPTSPAAAQVLRRDQDQQKTSPQLSLLPPRVELAAFAIGTIALVWFTNRMHLLNFGSHHAKGAESGSFTQGFLVASTACTLVALAGARYLSAKIDFSSDFSKHPAHKPAGLISSPSSHATGVISPTEYRRFTLRSKKELSQGISQFVFDLPHSYSVLGLPIGQHIAIRGQVGDQTITRSYTPVSNNRDLGRLELLVRIYPDGQLGKFMSALQPGDVAEIRGPKGQMRYRKGMSKHIGMIGGGTGITPLYQLIRAICEDPTDTTHISLIYGNRSESDIMLRKQLDHFERTSNGKFKAYYTLDKPEPGWQGGTGYITKDVLKERMPPVEEGTKILLCGPPGMVNASIKNLVALGFEQPPAVSKMSDQIFCF